MWVTMTWQYVRNNSLQWQQMQSSAHNPVTANANAGRTSNRHGRVFLISNSLHELEKKEKCISIELLATGRYQRCLWCTDWPSATSVPGCTGWRGWSTCRRYHFRSLGRSHWMKNVTAAKVRAPLAAQRPAVDTSCWTSAATQHTQVPVTDQWPAQGTVLHDCQPGLLASVR